MQNTAVPDSASFEIVILLFYIAILSTSFHSGEECNLPNARLCGGAKRGSLQHSCYEQHVINHKALIASVVNLAEIFHSKTTSQADNSRTNYRPQKFIKNMMRLMCIKALAPDNFLVYLILKMQKIITYRISLNNVLP